MNKILKEVIDNTNKLREVMGTLPTQTVELKTEFKRGVEGITVELIDQPVNPYKAMYVLATSCWGSKINKWEETLPEHRFLVVKAVLERAALPLALEAASFTFAVEGPSRAAFDQLARTRIGAVFSAKGMRDNNWKDAAIRIPTSLWPTSEEFNFMDAVKDGANMNIKKSLEIGSKVARFETIKDSMIKVKQTYADIVDTGTSSWQAARTVLPLYVVYGYSVCYNYAALLNVCANRMKFCEMEDTAAVAWLMQKEIAKKFPLLGSHLRPGCDKTKSCQYHKSYSLSEMFGCLFKECGRNVCKDSNGYAEFNETCTNYRDLEDQLDIHITRPNEWPVFDSFDDLHSTDQVYFMR